MTFCNLKAQNATKEAVFTDQSSKKLINKTSLISSGIISAGISSVDIPCVFHMRIRFGIGYFQLVAHLRRYVEHPRRK